MQLIKFVDLGAQWQEQRDQLLPIIEGVLESGVYVDEHKVCEFEDSVSKFLNVKHVIGLNSGTDALVLGLKALGVASGDEVITPPNSFIASTEAIEQVGARPVFVDVLPDQNIDPLLIEKAITKNTKAIMPVHLTGRMADMISIMGLSKAYDIPVIEDAAQAIGSKYADKFSGLWGKIGCFSAHPLKNLNAMGDSGFLVTDDDRIASEVRCLRNHGLVNRETSERFGLVSRMDVLQASILEFRLGSLQDVITKRRENADLYYATLSRKDVYVPPGRDLEFNTWHTFVIQTSRRDNLKDYLLEHNIETSIHYPIPIHLQPAARKLGYDQGDFPKVEEQAKNILSLPVHQYLASNDIEYVATMINKFFDRT